MFAPRIKRERAVQTFSGIWGEQIAQRSDGALFTRARTWRGSTECWGGWRPYTDPGDWISGRPIQITALLPSVAAWPKPPQGGPFHRYSDG